MGPPTVLDGRIDRRETEIEMRWWRGGAASWGELAAQGVTVHNDCAHRTPCILLQKCSKAMSRPACFASTKVLQAGPDPEANSREMDLTECGPSHKKIPISLS
jgi:hypothetical protein